MILKIEKLEPFQDEFSCFITKLKFKFNLQAFFVLNIPWVSKKKKKKSTDFYGLCMLKRFAFHDGNQLFYFLDYTYKHLV